MTQLILLDIDGTLTELGGRIDYALLQPHLIRMMRAGFIIGLNSGRMMESQISFHRKLGLNGPIIAEFGNEVLWPERDFHFTDRDKEQAISRMRGEFSELCHEQHPKARQLFAGTADFHLLVNPHIGEDEELIVLIFQRRYSLFYLCRKRTAAGIELHRTLLDSVAPLAERVFMRNFTEIGAAEIDPEFCSHLLYRSDSIKANGAAILRSRFPDIGRIHMVGDWPIDFLADVENTRHYAVANAHSHFKLVADFTAPGRNAMGAIDCLFAIEQNSCSGGGQ